MRPYLGGLAGCHPFRNNLIMPEKTHPFVGGLVGCQPPQKLPKYDIKNPWVRWGLVGSQPPRNGLILPFKTRASVGVADCQPPETA